MKMRNLSIMGITIFLLVFSGIVPVVATDWGSPLAMDPAGDGVYPPEDISSVDALYTNDFVYFCFVMNYYLIDGYFYQANIDFDKNASTGASSDPYSDIGADLNFWAILHDYGSGDLQLEVAVSIYGSLDYWVWYNMTGSNGTAMIWSSPDIIPYFTWVTFLNNSYGVVVFGVNWTWITGLMASEGILGDNHSMYLEFETGSDSDYCPDLTSNNNDYIEWNIYAGEDDGIPGFSLGLVLVSLLLLLGVPVVLHKERFCLERQ